MYVNNCLKIWEDVTQKNASTSTHAIILSWDVFTKHQSLSHLVDVLDIISKDRKSYYTMGDFNLNFIDCVKCNNMNSFLNIMFTHCVHGVISKPTGETGDFSHPDRQYLH